MLRALPAFDPVGPASLTTWIPDDRDPARAQRAAPSRARRARCGTDWRPASGLRARTPAARALRLRARWRRSPTQRALLALREITPRLSGHRGRARVRFLGTVKSRLARARAALRRAARDVKLPTMMTRSRLSAPLGRLGSAAALRRPRRRGDRAREATGACGRDRSGAAAGAQALVDCRRSGSLRSRPRRHSSAAARPRNGSDDVVDPTARSLSLGPSSARLDVRGAEVQWRRDKHTVTVTQPRGAVTWSAKMTRS